MQKQSKRVFILGAGSSIGHSNNEFPSISGFFRSAKILGYHQQEEFLEIEKFVGNSWGRNISAKQRPINIEDLYTYIEIEIERKSSPELLNTRQQLLKLIQSVLINSEKKLQVHDGEYNQLVACLNQTDTIITFNWDLLIDNILGREAIDKKSNEFLQAKKEYPQYINFRYILSAHSEWQIANARVQELE